MICSIPFTLNDRNGCIEVAYKENTDIAESGFDMFSPEAFDPKIALGYPTMHARVSRYEGTGYRTASGWIQILHCRYYQTVSDTVPTASDACIDFGNPFFAYGYPSEIYDAPANNLGSYAKMEWVADTFLVPFPARWNNHTISFLCGFRWGYDDELEDGRHRVRLHDLQVLDKNAWAGVLPLLREKCPEHRFSE